MIIDHKTKVLNDCAVLYSDNYLNVIEGERLEEKCGELLEKGFKKVVIDFTSTDLVNSIGISILIGIMEKVRENNAKLLFSNLRKTNMDAFNMLGLTKYVPVYETQEEAIHSVLQN